MKNIIDTYIKNIKKQLICSTKESKEFLRILEENISEYSKTADVSSIDDIRQQFGEEIRVAEEFNEGYHPSEVRKRLDIKRLLLVIIISFVIFYVIMWTFFYIREKIIPTEYVESISYHGTPEEFESELAEMPSDGYYWQEFQ